MDQAKGKSEDLNVCFGKLMMLGGGASRGSAEMYSVVMNDWKDIPMELLLRIVSLVDDQTVIVASEVCSEWRDAISYGLTHLSLSWCKNNMNNLVLSIAPKFTRLQHLMLRQDKPQLEDNAIEAIARYCHDLLDLDLSKSFKLSNDSLYALADGCLNLIKLNISGCTSFTDVGLAKLAESCRNLKILNLCGCVKAATNKALQAIGCNCSRLQSLNLGWCEDVGDIGVMALAFGCPDLRALNLCGCVQITDHSVVALAHGCPHLKSLGLYYCRNITDTAMYSLVKSRMKNKNGMWESMNGTHEEEGLRSLNISQCTALTPHAVQTLCDSFPALHTCSGRHSLVMSGCLNLTSVHCACAVRAHRTGSIPSQAH